MVRRLPVLTFAFPLTLSLRRNHKKFSQNRTMVKSRTIILPILAMIPSICSLSTKATSSQSQVAIKAARDFTISQRKKLKELGALDIERPIKISGKSLIGKGKGEDFSDNKDDTTTVITKVIHFQRHGQGFHNMICDIWREKGLPIDFDSTDPNLNPVIRPEFLDPPLTETGRQQCKEKRSECAELSPELLIVSPLLRCIQTAKLSFQDHLPNNSDCKWLSHEGCREELGLLVGNKRRPISDIKLDHPDIDFSPIEYDEDKLWDDYGTEKRETLLEKSERIYKFLAEFVMNRPEREIAVVCHSAYLFTLLNAVMDIEDEDLRSWFLTSEVRSLAIEFSVNEKYYGISQ